MHDRSLLQNPAKNVENILKKITDVLLPEMNFYEILVFNILH